MTFKERPPADDAHHTLFYISPGEHRGGYGRTYSYMAVQNAAQEKLARERGYWPTLERAFEVADAKKAGRPVPPEAPAASDERDPITGDVVSKDEDGGDLKPAGPALAEVQVALGKLKEAKGAKVVGELVKGFGAAAATKLKPEQYAEVIAAAEAKAKE